MDHKKGIQVLYVLTKLELGGAQKVCLALRDGVAKEGIFTGLISGSEGVLIDVVKGQADVHLLKMFKREVHILSFWKELHTFFAMIIKMRVLKKQVAQLVVHTHSTKAGIMGRWAAFFAGISTRIHTVHGWGFHEHQSKMSWFFTFVLEWLTSFITTQFICVSHKDAQEGVLRIPFFSKKHSVIRAAVAWDEFYEPAVLLKELSSESDFIIGTVACFKPQKNIFDLLKAFHFMWNRLPNERKKTVFLQIIGDGILRPEIEQWIQAHDLSLNIQLLGWRSDVAVVIKQWNLFALSSLWEGLPCAIVEARLARIPVVAYDVGGIREVIHHGKNGFLVASRAWVTMGLYFEQLVIDGKLYQTMRSFDDLLIEFSIPEMVEKHVALYRHLALGEKR